LDKSTLVLQFSNRSVSSATEFTVREKSFLSASNGNKSELEKKMRMGILIRIRKLHYYPSNTTRIDAKLHNLIFQVLASCKCEACIRQLLFSFEVLIHFEGKKTENIWSRLLEIFM